MKSKFLFSLENILQQTSFACLSLKFGSFFSALILILYSIFAIAQCLNDLLGHLSNDDKDVIVYGVVFAVSIIHIVILYLSTLMLAGVLKEKASLMKPWLILITIQVIVSALAFVFWTMLSMIYHFNDSSLLFLEFLQLIIRFYMLMIVTSFFKQLEERQTEERERLRDSET